MYALLQPTTYTSVPANTEVNPAYEPGMYTMNHVEQLIYYYVFTVTAVCVMMKRIELQENNAYGQISQAYIH